MAKEAKSKWNGFSLKKRKEMPDGLWTRCPACEHMLYKSAVEKNLNVCPECDYHFRIDALTRIGYLVDEGSFEETHSHTFFTPIASLWVSKVNMVMRPAQLQNVYRAHLHAR